MRILLQIPPPDEEDDEQYEQEDFDWKEWWGQMFGVAALLVIFSLVFIFSH